MQISLRQTGGVFGGERQVRVTQNDLHVTGSGVSTTRTLTDEEAASVDDLATQLMHAAPSGAFPGEAGASDSMLTEVEISGDGPNGRRYQVHSGGDAPTELWRLVGKLTEVADRSSSSG